MQGEILSYVHLKVFADDTILISVYGDRAKLKQILFSDRSSLLLWLKEMYVRFNTSKSHFIVFSIRNSENLHLKHFMIERSEIGHA